jgi:hypothetical protein
MARKNVQIWINPEIRRMLRVLAADKKVEMKDIIEPLIEGEYKKYVEGMKG